MSQALYLAKLQPPFSLICTTILNLSERIPEILNIVNYREQGREFLLETANLSGAQAIPQGWKARSHRWNDS